MNCKGDDDVDAKRSRPSIGKPAKCHARKERVLVVGTDQRITSGPAAKRLHSKAGYMAAPERFAKKSDSFPLHRGRRPYMALRSFMEETCRSRALLMVCTSVPLGAMIILRCIRSSPQPRASAPISPWMRRWQRNPSA